MIFEPTRTVYICDQKTPPCSAPKIYPNGTALNSCGTYCKHTADIDCALFKGKDEERTFIFVTPYVLQEVEPAWEFDWKPNVWDKVLNKLIERRKTNEYSNDENRNSIRLP